MSSFVEVPKHEVAGCQQKQVTKSSSSALPNRESVPAGRKIVHEEPEMPLRKQSLEKLGDGGSHEKGRARNGEYEGDSIEHLERENRGAISGMLGQNGRGLRKALDGSSPPWEQDGLAPKP